MTNEKTLGESIRKDIKEIATVNIKLSSITLSITSIAFIILFIIFITGYILYKWDQKVNSVISSNNTVREFALKNSEQTILLKIIDEKIGIKAPVQTKVQLTQTIYSLATIKKIPLNIICGLIETESNWTPSVTSDANAKGLMQVLPQYARPYLRYERIEYNPDVLYDPVINSIVGISILADYHAAHVEAGKEKEDDFTITLHSYFWGPENTKQLYGKQDGRVNIPNMSYPMRVLEKAKYYKERGL